MEQELQNMKKQIKDNIQYLLDNKKLEKSLFLIDKYLKVASFDPEMYSLKLIITMMKGINLDSENILKNVLEREPYNEELLFNLSYLMDKKKEDKQALEYFCKVKLFNPSSNVNVGDIISNFKPISSNLRILNGTIEIANQMNTITKGLRKLVLEAKALNYYPSYLGYKCDYVLDINLYKDINAANVETKKLAAKMIAENDVFHFHFGTSLAIDYSDLQLLKNLGKKVLMQHWGSDIRMYSKAVMVSPNVKVKELDENKIKRRLEFLSKNISHCAVCDYELYDYVKDYYENIHIIRQCIDLSDFKLNNTKNNKLLIVHAPTNREIKGTKYILKAIEDLKLNYDFDFKLIENMSYEDAMKTYRNADIVIDQLLIGSYGLVAIENMALGKPVICYINEKMKEKYPSELPIISCGIENIKEKIEYLIKNQDDLKTIGINGRKYVEKYHDINKLNSEIVKIYEEI